MLERVNCRKNRFDLQRRPILKNSRASTNLILLQYKCVPPKHLEFPNEISTSLHWHLAFIEFSEVLTASILPMKDRILRLFCILALSVLKWFGADIELLNFFIFLTRFRYG